MTPTNWLPFYPDLLPRHPWRLAPALASQPPYNPAIFPVPNLLATLTFLPTFPDRVPRLRVTREKTSETSGATIPVATYPVAWLAWYPDQVPPRRLATAAHGGLTEPPAGAQVVIAQRLAWLARYPDRVPHQRPLHPAGLDWAIDPQIAARVPCADLAQEGLGVSAFLAASLGVPLCVGEGLGRTTLLNEDLC